LLQTVGGLSLGRSAGPSSKRKQSKKEKEKIPQRKTEEEDFVVSNNPRGEQPGRFWSPVFPSI
jgi:hypothetical protein